MLFSTSGVRPASGEGFFHLDTVVDSVRIGLTSIDFASIGHYIRLHLLLNAIAIILVHPYPREQKAKLDHNASNNKGHHFTSWPKIPSMF